MPLCEKHPLGHLWSGTVGQSSLRALGDTAQIQALTRVDQIGAPVFVQLADYDALFPASYAAVEAQFYSGALRRHGRLARQQRAQLQTAHGSPGQLAAYCHLAARYARWLISYRVQV